MTQSSYEQIDAKVSPGQSVLGLLLLIKIPSKVPAHSSRFVRKLLRLKIFLTVAGMDECSNCEVG